jgi:hypothetical protein
VVVSRMGDPQWSQHSDDSFLPQVDWPLSVAKVDIGFGCFVGVSYSHGIRSSGIGCRYARLLNGVGTMI